VALAEEIGFADGLVGEGNVKGRSGQNHTNSDKERGEDAKVAAHKENPKKKYSADLGAAHSTEVSSKL
jgi:hypothetical protein